MNTEPSPMTVAAYAIGLVLAIPTLIALVRLIFFVASASAKLDQCVDGIGKLSEFKHATNNTLHEHGTRLTLVERDVEQLKEGAA